MNNTDSQTAAASRHGMLIIGILFFIFGFVTWLNSVLIPFLREACELTDAQAYLVTFAFYISYFVMAMPSSYILRRVGYAHGISLGLSTMAVGALLFVPAAIYRTYSLFLIGLFIEGTGLALLQTAANPYVTVLGPIESAARRMSIMGICNKVAGMIGIFIMGSALFSRWSDIPAADMANRVILPYLVIAFVLVLLALWIEHAHLPAISMDNPETAADEDRKDRTGIWRYPYLWLGVICLFLYVGVEVIAIDTLPLYGEAQGIPTEQAVHIGIFSLIALTAGYLIGIVTVPRMISQRQALILCATLGILLTVGALWTDGMWSIACVVMLSFAHALMWPCIWPLSIEGLGKYTATASALLIMAIAGGAVMPQVYAHLAEQSSRQAAYALLLPMYAYMVFFALKGCRIGRK
ncbi:MAG: sugar MFS transporter [Bacteroidales bacterium]|nr:sugar MFS transporter [Bacteroidales bacterium]